MKVRVLGDIAALDEDIRTRILELEEATKITGAEFPDCIELWKQR